MDHFDVLVIRTAESRLLASVPITDFPLLASYLDLRIDSKMTTGPHTAVRLI